MPTFIDNKGKFFTDVISKELVRVEIQTLTQFITGDLHVKRNVRVVDMLNSAEQYLALTGVKVYDLRGDEIQNCPFLAVNRDQIVWIIPQESGRYRDDQEIE